MVTREAYVTFDGAPYDPTDHSNAFDRHISEMVLAQGGAGVVAGRPADFGFPDFEAAERRHDAFDRLSATAPADRKPTDTVAEDVPSVLDELLGSSKSQPGDDAAPGRGELIRVAQRTANKLIAHAADHASRQQFGDLPDGVRLRDILTVHETLLCVAQFFAT